MTDEHGDAEEAVFIDDAPVEEGEPVARATGVESKAPNEVESTRRSRDYELPLVHVRIPARAVDLGFLATLGAVAVVGAVELPVAGAAAAGLYLLRRRHDREAREEPTGQST